MEHVSVFATGQFIRSSYRSKLKGDTHAYITLSHSLEHISFFLVLVFLFFECQLRQLRLSINKCWCFSILTEYLHKEHISTKSAVKLLYRIDFVQVI